MIREAIRDPDNIRPPINLEIEVVGGVPKDFYLIHLLASKRLFDEMTGRSARGTTFSSRSVGFGESGTLESLADILDDFVASYLEVNETYCR